MSQTEQWQLPELALLSLGPTLIVMVVAVNAVLSEMFPARSVSSDLVIGAVCLYIPVGLAWAFLYFDLLALARFDFRFASFGTFDDFAQRVEIR